MRRIQLRMLFLLLILVHAGCVTQYQPYGVTGGYEDKKIGDNKYMVEFQGNGYTSHSTVLSYAKRRALELCQQNGYENYQVLENLSTSSGGTLPDNYYCNGSSKSNGNFSANCTNFGGGTVAAHNVKIYLTCVAPNNDDSMESECLKNDAYDICNKLAETFTDKDYDEDEDENNNHYERAIKFSLKSCESGNLTGCKIAAEIGLRLHKMKNYNEALNLFETGCKKGLALGCWGIGITKFSLGENKVALNFMTMACDQDEPRACEGIPSFFPKEKNNAEYIAKAKTLYSKKCKEAHDSYACGRLMEMAKMAH